jgi:hypothetical protein
MVLTKDMFNYLIPTIRNKRKIRNTSHHVALLMKGKKIVKMEANKVGSRKKGCGYSNQTIHAEIAVVKKLGDLRALKNMTMVVLRYGHTDNNWLISKPCAQCQVKLEKFIREYGLKCVFHT